MMALGVVMMLHSEEKCDDVVSIYMWCTSIYSMMCGAHSADVDPG